MHRLIEVRYIGSRNAGGWEYEGLGIYPTVAAAMLAVGSGLEWQTRKGLSGLIAYPPCDCAACRREPWAEDYPCQTPHWIIEPVNARREYRRQTRRELFVTSKRVKK